MKPFARCRALLFAIVLAGSLAGCKDKTDLLVGTYSVEEQGQLREYYRIQEIGSKFFLSDKHSGQWGSSVEVTPVSTEELARVLRAPVTIEFIGLGNDNLGLFQVPKGWKSGAFVCNTGYLIATVLGPRELHKN
jgi:hypothetical protein